MFLHSHVAESMTVRLTSQLRSPCYTAQCQSLHVFKSKGLCPSQNHNDFKESLNSEQLLSQVQFTDGLNGEIKRVLLLIKKPPQLYSIHMPENVAQVLAMAHSNFMHACHVSTAYLSW